MILDGHVHIRGRNVDAAAFLARIKEAGVDGAVVISLPPACFNREALGADERLDNLLRWTEADENLFPFLWIDPADGGAVAQVDAGVKRGVAGFKVICGHHHPGDARAMPVYRKIAAAGKPILFHSGILWDGKPSGNFCRPCNFEALLGVDGLRFTLAHISWPWCDECVAVYGKVLNAGAGRQTAPVEMFVDVTPGTPPIYRRDALTKLFTVGYDVGHNVIFGTDCCTDDYNVAWAREWIERDNAIYAELGLSQEVVDGIYAENLRRFVGVSSASVRHKTPRPAQ